MTHIYIPKSSDMWCIHHYGSTDCQHAFGFQGPLKSSYSSTSPADRRRVT